MEEQMRQIAEQVYQEMKQNDQFVNFKVQLHRHNGTDNTPINAQDVVGSQILSSDPGSVLSPGALQSNNLIGPNVSPNGTFVFPLPVIESNGLDGFGEGDAPEGTCVLFTFPGNAILYCRVGFGWHGVELDL